MIDVYAKDFDGVWVGLASDGKRVVATTISPTRGGALRTLRSNIPANAEYQVAQRPSDFAEQTMRMLKELHAGNELAKTCALAEEYFSSPSARVLKIAAAIPIGYVASYGNIAQAADTGPRVVGRIMATNPLYPIVPCHRVVGADFSLVGYGGRKNPRALQAKLSRLSEEAKGFSAEKEVTVEGRTLTVYPVEYVLRKVRKQHSNRSLQQRLFKE